MPHPVFISYARDASREHARALYDALGGEPGGLCFLDTEDIELGDRFPERLVDALFDARVVVIFAEPLYFTRRYCLQEFDIACKPFLLAVERPGTNGETKEQALRGIVLALGGKDAMLDRFPPGVQGRNWPRADQTVDLAALVRGELERQPLTLRERFRQLGDDAAERALQLAATLLPPPQKIGQIPSVPAFGLRPSIHDAFVGRADDVWRVHRVLTSRRGDLRTAAGLTGSIEAGGGFGKTRLALEYLYRFGTRHFRGGLFWIDAEQPEEPQLYEVLQALTPSTPDIDIVRAGQGGVPGAVARAIRGLPGDNPPPLFVIDNVPEPAPGEPPKRLETWCPVLSEVSVLATSRTQVALGEAGVVPVRLNVLNPDSAVALLVRDVATAGSLNPEQWLEIAAWVGHLPLALELLNGALRASAITPRDLLDASRSQQPVKLLDEAMNALRESVPEGALRGISEALSISYQKLTPEQRRAAHLLAWFAPAPIPEAALTELGPIVFSAETRAALRFRSLVTGVTSEGAFFGTMHRVLADFLVSQSPALVEEVHVVGITLTHLVDAAKGQGNEGASRIREYLPAIRVVFERSAGFPNAKVQVLADLLGETIGIELSGWGMPEEAGRLFKAVLEMRRRILGDEHPDTLASMNNLATTLSDRGDHAGAQALQERVLEVTMRILGEEHPDALRAMNNLANTLADRGDHTGAQALQEQVLEATMRILGEEHPEALRAMYNLADMRRYQGDYAGAQSLQERALEAMQRILGEEHPETLRSMNSLASTLRDRGDHEGAQVLQERVLEARRRVLGEEHPDTLTSVNNLANTLVARGDHAGAQVLQERGLKARLRILGEEHPNTSVSAWNLVVAFEAGGKDAAHIIERHLRWLLERDPNTLGETQRVIRDYLEAHSRKKQKKKPWWRFW